MWGAVVGCEVSWLLTILQMIGSHSAFSSMVYILRHHKKYVKTFNNSTLNISKENSGIFFKSTHTKIHIYILENKIHYFVIKNEK